nr:hypothetical protein [Roseicella aerolata]
MAERPAGVRGLAVPAVPTGSPGMEVPGQPDDDYDVVAFGEGEGRRVYMRFRAAGRGDAAQPSAAVDVAQGHGEVARAGGHDADEAEAPDDCRMPRVSGGDGQRDPVRQVRCPHPPAVPAVSGRGTAMTAASPRPWRIGQGRGLGFGPLSAGRPPRKWAP